MVPADHFMKVGKKSQPLPNVGARSTSCQKLQRAAGTTVSRLLTESMQEVPLLLSLESRTSQGYRKKVELVTKAPVV